MPLYHEAVPEVTLKHPLKSQNTYIYVHIFLCIYLYVYIYIYIPFKVALSISVTWALSFLQALLSMALNFLKVVLEWCYLGFGLCTLVSRDGRLHLQSDGLSSIHAMSSDSEDSTRRSQRDVRSRSPHRAELLSPLPASPHGSQQAPTRLR